jgi:hypothetical protein
MTRPTARSVIRSSGSGLLLAAIVVFLAGTSPAADLPTSEDCLACHADKDLTRGVPAPGRSPSLFVDAPVLKASTHGTLECVGCHKAATAPHDEKLPPVNCAGCHDKAGAALGTGIHGAAKARGGPRAVACSS